MRANRIRIGVVIVTLLTVALANIVRAQTTGETISVLIPADANQPEPYTGPATDKVVVTGRSMGAANIAGCGSGEFPLQKAVIVDPDGVRAPRTAELIFIFYDPDGAGLRPGTRLASFSFQADCAIGSVAYTRYSAVVE